MSVRIAVIAFIIASLVFVLDLATPLGVAGGVPYLALILCGWWFHERSAVFFLAVIGTILTILGYFLSPDAGVDWIVLLNRAYALFALWATSIFVWWTWRERGNAGQRTVGKELLERTKGIHRLGKEGVFVLALIAVIIASSWGVLFRIENGVKADIAKSLETILEKSHAAIRHRYAAEKHMATVWANDMRIKAFTERLLELPQHPATLKNNAVQHDVRKLLLPVIKASGLRGYFIIDKEYTNLASSRDNNIGLKNLLGKQSNFLARVWAGETNISLPLPSEVPLENDAGQLLSDVSTMFAAAPIRDAEGNVIAIFTLRMDPDILFSSVFLQSQTGDSGETYLFDKTGLLISESRFNETLTQIGMLKQDGHSDLHVHLRDPGTNLTLGYKPTLPLDHQPLTLMARSATQGKSGANLDGYRDYRGVPVVGTWHWDEELNIGIASEVDIQEAFSTYHDMRFFVLFSSGLSVALLITLGVGSFLSKQNLWAAKQQADFANNAKSDLLANMSHELRTPLNAVIGFSSVMKSQIFGPMNSKYLDYAKDINSAGGHLLELINDILDTSAIRAGKLELHEECLIIKDIVASTVNMTSAVAVEGNIQLANKLADDLPQIYGDERRIRQVLLNLLSNAIKFTPAGGQVTLSTELDDQNALIFTVTDTGVGMDEKEQAMAMTKFGQVESGLSRRFQGTGLGLPLTESLVQLHGGSLKLVSEKGTGTTVTVRLPAARTMVASEASVAC